MQSTVLLPCLLALLAWPVVTRKQYHDEAPAREKVVTPSHADDKLHRVLQLLSVTPPKVRGHQTNQAQAESENDAANLANQIQLNHRTEVKKLLDAMYSHGGAKRITNAMPYLLNLGYSREGVYQWLKGTSPPPARIMPDNVEVEDSKLEQLEEDKIASMKKYFDGQLETLNEDTQSTPTTKLQSDSPSQPEQFGKTMDEATKTVDETIPLDKPDKLKSAKVQSTATAVGAGALSKLDAVVKQVVGTNAAGTHVEPENVAEAEAIEARFKLFMNADARDAPKTIIDSAMATESIPHSLQAAREPQPDQQTQVDASTLLKYIGKRDDKALRAVYEEMRRHGGKERIIRAEALISDQQSQADAALLMKYISKHDNKGLRTAYEEMRGHGGKERINRAEALFSKMGSTEDQPEATVQLALQSNQEAQAAQRRQDEIDAVTLLNYGKSRDNHGLLKFYDMMDKHGGGDRVERVENIARTMQARVKR